MPFKPGNNENPTGRPKGARHKLSEAFALKLAKDFEENGVSAIIQTRQDNPVKYLEIIASLLPKEAEVKHSGEIEHTIRQVALSRVDEILAGIDYSGGMGGDEPEVVSH